MAFILPDQVDVFPHPYLSQEDGFLAVSENITVERLLLAYQFGIFPWNGPEDPVLWWYTHPRCVLYPEEIKIQKSMKSYLNNEKFGWSMDTSFDRVIDHCMRAKRKDQQGTWITDIIKTSFQQLHEMGYAHSVEIWQEEKLVGGLYGLSLGKIFFGESMFAHVSNASKFALIKLAQWLKDRNFWLIDCQQDTAHLRTMGSQLISKEDFFEILKRNALQETLLGPWVK